MGDVFRTAGPRHSIQAAEPEDVVEDLGETRGVNRRQPGTPPAPAPGEVTGRLAVDPAPTALQDQPDTPESMMISPESPQRRDEMTGVVVLQNGHPHLGPALGQPIQPRVLPAAGPMRLGIDPVEEPPDGAGRDDRDGRGSRPAANRSGAVRAMNPIVLVLRRLVMALLLVAALAIGAVVGLAKMGVELPSPLSTPKVNAYADSVGARARQMKDYIAGKVGSYFHKHEEEHHQEYHKVVVTSPVVQDVVITQPFVSQIRSQRHIEIRALEPGYLLDIRVQEGQAVKKGSVLFKIQPILYQAKLEAEQAEADYARLKWQYTDMLAKKQVVSKAEVALADAERKRAQAKAALAQAEANFTDVKAPFDGIVDRLLQREGSLIKEGDILTTLSDNSVMWVYFNVPEKYYLEYMANREQHEKEDKIELMLANGEMFPQPGKIGAIEADFNNENGNIKFRADYPNPKGLLRNGQTGTIKIRRPLKNALLIPQRAIFELLDKRYVWVVGEDDVAKQTLITVKHELEDIFVVDSGLKVGDKIVLEGVREVEQDAKVEYEFRKPEEALDTKNQKFHAE
jgi:membrane fusion protein (multidrug efflux system)